MTAGVSIYVRCGEFGGWRAYFVGGVDFAPFAVDVFFAVHRQVVAFVFELLAEGFAAELRALDHAAQGAV